MWVSWYISRASEGASNALRCLIVCTSIAQHACVGCTADGVPLRCRWDGPAATICVKAMKRSEYLAPIDQSVMGSILLAQFFLHTTLMDIRM